MILMLISVVLLVGIDQYTKYLTLMNITPSEYIPLIGDIFGLTYVKNEGSAFGMLQGQQWLFIIFTVIVLIGIIYVYIKIPREKKYYPMKLILILFVAGAIGNFFDRIRFKYVVDMLYFKLIDFPVFNMADCYVVIGAIILIALMIFKYNDEDFAFLKRSNK